MTSQPAKVYLVGAGPGDPELLTVKAHKLIQQADLILHDDLVSPEILAVAGQQTLVFNVGKRCGAKAITQADINRRMIDCAHGGLSVVRLKGGDPSIFGRLAEEIEALFAAQIPFEIVPGVTASSAAAAALGVSLTDRRSASRLIVVSGHPSSSRKPEQQTGWRSVASEDATLAIYMPGKDFRELRIEMLSAGMSPGVPAILVSQASASCQQCACTILEKLDELPKLEPPCILLIGRSLSAAKLAKRPAALLQAELLLSSL